MAMAPPMIRISPCRADRPASRAWSGPFRAADDRCKLAAVGDPGLAKAPRVGLSCAAVGGSLWPRPSVEACGAVRGGECIVHPYVAGFASSANEGRCRFSLRRNESGIFQAHDVAGLHGRNDALGRLPDAVVGEPDRPLDDPRDLGGDRFERMLGIAPLRQPKCESRITLPPLSASSVIAGAARSMRVASVTTSFSTGTFRSTRSRIRLPFTSTRSSVRNPVIGRPAATVRATCPSQRLCLPCGWRSPTHCRTSDITRTRLPSMTLVWSSAKVEEAGVVEVDGDKWLEGVVQDALQRTFRRSTYAPCSLHHRHDSLTSNLRSTTDTFGVGTRIDMPSSLPLSSGRDHEADGLGGTGRCRDHRHRCRAGAVEILVHRVQRRLVARIGVDRGHEAVFDAESILQHLRHRRQAIGRARGVRDDHMVLVSLSWFTPYTTVTSAPSAGAETITRLAPAVRCADAFSLDVNMPVHSRAMSTPSSFQGSWVGSFSR